MPRPSETISSVGEVLKAAGELLKAGRETALQPALLAAGAAWLGPAFTLAAGAVTLVKPIANLIENRTGASPPEIGKKALTGAFIAAAVMALHRVGRPESKIPFDDNTAAERAFDASLSFEYFGTLAGFDPQHPTTHPYYWFAQRTLDGILSALEYSPTERRLIAAKTEESFLEIWQNLKADQTSHRSVAAFEEWANDTPPSFLDTLVTHIEHQRWSFRQKPLLGKERFSSADVYVNTDAAPATGQDMRDSGQRAFEKQISGDLMDGVEKLLGDPDFVDMILIEAPPGYGKSTFTLYASDYLYGRGLRPLRIRIRDLPSIGKQTLWEALESRIAWRPPEEPPSSILRSVKRVKDPFQGGAIFEQSTRWGDADICPYVLILDGWDEVAAGTTEEYRERLRSLLREIRRIFLERDDPRMANAAQVRLILTGRPGDGIFPPEILTRGLAVFRLEPFTKDQLRTFFGRLRKAVERSGDAGAKYLPTDWPKHPRWEQLKEVADLYDPVQRDSVLGSPLLAHLTLWIYARRLESDAQVATSALLSDTTALYRQLVELTSEEAGKADFEHYNTSVRERHKVSGTELRDLIRRTAAASYCSGDSGPVSYQELLAYLPRNHSLTVSAAAEVNPLSRLMVSYYFTSKHPERGCEFVHKSFVEYLYAEAIVEWMKTLAQSDFDPAVPISQDEITAPSAGDSVVWLLRCLSAGKLNDEVLKHLLRLIEWEIARSNNRTPAGRGETEPVPLASWVTAGAVMTAVRFEIGADSFFRPGEDGTPALYHLLAGSVNPERRSPLSEIDQSVCAGWVNIEAILRDALHRMAKEPPMEIGGEGIRDGRWSVPLLRRASRGGRLILRSVRIPVGLVGLDLRDCDLRNADLTGGSFPQARLFGCDLRGADLTGAGFDRAVIASDFRGALVGNVNFSHARLHESDLSGVDFAGADLECADLSAASVQGAKFADAKNLTQKQIDQAFGDLATTLPQGLRRPGTWPYD